MKRITMFLGAGILLLCSTVFAAVPQLINFQGILRDGSGNPVPNGSYSVAVRIYDVPSGPGLALWSDTFNVNTTGGLFNVVLGSEQPLPAALFSNSNLWVGLQVGGDPEAAPRTQLTSVPYSARVGTVDGATGGVISGDVSIQSNLAVDGAMNAKNILLIDPGPVQTPLSIQGSAGQSANLMEIKNSAGMPLAGVDADGGIFLADAAGAHALWIHWDANKFGTVISGGSGDDAIHIQSPADGANVLLEPGLGGGVGIGLGAVGPHSSLQVNGSIATAVHKVNDCTITLNETHHVVLMPATLDGCHVYLPTAVGISGREYTIKATAIEIGGTLIIHPVAGQTIDGNSSIGLSMSNGWVTIISDGENWWIIGKEQ